MNATTPPIEVDHALWHCVYLWATTEAGEEFLKQSKAAEKLNDLMTTFGKDGINFVYVSEFIAAIRSMVGDVAADTMVDNLPDVDLKPDDEFRELEDVCRLCHVASECFLDGTAL